MFWSKCGNLFPPSLHSKGVASSTPGCTSKHSMPLCPHSSGAPPLPVPIWNPSTHFPAMCVTLHIITSLISVLPQQACGHLAGAQHCQVVEQMLLACLGAGKLFGWGLIPSISSPSDAFWEVLRDTEEEKYLLLAVRPAGRSECWLHIQFSFYPGWKLVAFWVGPTALWG